MLGQRLNLSTELNANIDILTIVFVKDGKVMATKAVNEVTLPLCLL